jgi:hypothetical protein
MQSFFCKKVGGGEWGTRGPHGGASALGGSADLKRLALGIRGMGNGEQRLDSARRTVARGAGEMIACFLPMPYALCP